MKKAGPLNDALHDIVEIDKQVAEVRRPDVIPMSAGHEIRFLKKSRSDKVSMLQHAGSDLPTAR